MLSIGDKLINIQYHKIYRFTQHKEYTIIKIAVEVSHEYKNDYEYCIVDDCGNNRWFGESGYLERYKDFFMTEYEFRQYKIDNLLNTI